MWKICDAGSLEDVLCTLVARILFSYASYESYTSIIRIMLLMSFMNLLSLIYILIPARSKHGMQATSMDSDNELQM